VSGGEPSVQLLSIYCCSFAVFKLQRNRRDADCFIPIQEDNGMNWMYRVQENYMLRMPEVGVWRFFAETAAA
jgi:hypothetical protein